jgi:hypothetical protein
MIETYDFEMFTKSGNNACRSVVNKAIKKIGGKRRITEESLLEYCRGLVAKVAEKHKEVRDTEPGWHMCQLINRSLDDAGYSFEISRYDLLRGI